MKPNFFTNRCILSGREVLYKRWSSHTIIVQLEGNMGVCIFVGVGLGGGSVVRGLDDFEWRGYFHSRSI